jgi:phosphoglycerol transferase MdoB-like AlkP superfamily enzyme
MEQMGSNEVIDRDVLRSPNAEFPIDGPELNYFGYSEKKLKPYIRNAIVEAEEKGERLFLSHITTSTHHPWATPEEFGEQENYFGDGRAGGSPLNRYLNTVKFADQWVGDVLNLLDELGVAEKTLVVMLGDQ